MMQPPERRSSAPLSDSRGFSTFGILAHPRQHRERPLQRLRHRRLIDRRLGIAGKDWQRQREFLRHRFPDIDRIASEGLERGFFGREGDFRLLFRGWAVNQREAVGNRSANRLEGHGAALLEIRRIFGFQKDLLGVLPPKFYFGDEAVEGYQVEPPRKLLPFLRTRFDSLPERSCAQLGECYEPGEFRRHGAHRASPCR